MDITDVQLDSRKVQPGTCFIAVKGAVADGHLFIAKAIEAGAVAIVCEVLPSERTGNVTMFRRAIVQKPQG